MALENGDSRPRADSAARRESRSTERWANTNASQTSKEAPPEVPGLPRLSYNLWDHKTKLFTVTALLVIEASLLPVGLYYGLWYGTTLQHGILFAIITAFFGLVTGVEFAHRSWRLVCPPDTYRPLGGSRWFFDYTHYTLSFGYTYMTAILIGGSIPNEPIVRVLAMPVPLLILQLGAQLVFSGVMYSMGVRARFRVSSVAPGERVLPAVYTFVEDVVAVDGGAGKTYRMRLRERFDASPMFRSMIVRLNWLWGVGGLIDGIGTVVVIWAVPEEEVAYGVGWLSPLVFVAIWAYITVYWCQRSLLIEKERWAASITSSPRGDIEPEMLENGGRGPLNR